MIESGDLTGLLSRRNLPPAFERWRVVLPPGTERPTEASEWAGALVLVEHGVVEVQCTAGGHRTFAAGDLLWLGWLPLRMLRNRGATPVQLLAVRRRGPPPTDAFLRVTRSRPADTNDRSLDEAT